MSLPLKTCTKCRVNKDNADFFRHSRYPDGLRPQCKACTKNYDERRKDKIATYKADWKKRNWESVSAREYEWRKNNAEHVKSYFAEYRAENVVEIKSRRKLEYTKHKSDYVARAADIRAREIKATPKWVDRTELKKIYRECPSGYHVDHIIPLKNDFVCGLHVPWNLQYLTAEENLRKGNRLIGFKEL